MPFDFAAVVNTAADRLKASDPRGLLRPSYRRLVFSVDLLSNRTIASPAVPLSSRSPGSYRFLGGRLRARSIHHRVLMVEHSFDIEAPAFTWPSRIHRLLFGLLLILGLTIMLIATLNAAPHLPRARHTRSHARRRTRATGRRRARPTQPSKLARPSVHPQHHPR
jgi:hypothetical protein